MMQYSNPYSFEKTDVRGQKLKNIAPNVDAMKSSGNRRTNLSKYSKIKSKYKPCTNH